MNCAVKCECYGVYNFYQIYLLLKHWHNYGKNLVFECVRKVLKCDPWSPNEYECVEFEISDLWNGKIIARYNAVTDYVIFYDPDAYKLIQRFNTEKAIVPLFKNCRNVSPLAEP